MAGRRRLSSDVARPLAELEHAVRSTAIARAVETAVEPDRAMLAYAVHDGLTQVVTASVLELESLARRVEIDPPRPPAPCARRSTSFAGARRDPRDADDAHPAEPSPPSPSSRRSGRASEVAAPATWSVEGDLTSVPATVLDVASSVIREAVANAAKHAETDRVSVRVRARDGAVEVSVEDHGTGSRRGRRPPATSAPDDAPARRRGGRDPGHRPAPRRRDAGRRSPPQRPEVFVKVLIVDDHALVRRGLGHVVRDCFQAEVVEASGAASALELMPHDVEIALVDVRMPDSTASSCSTS